MTLGRKQDSSGSAGQREREREGEERKAGGRERRAGDTGKRAGLTRAASPLAWWRVCLNPPDLFHGKGRSS